MTSKPMSDEELKNDFDNGIEFAFYVVNTPKEFNRRIGIVRDTLIASAKALGRNEILHFDDGLKLSFEKGKEEGKREVLSEVETRLTTSLKAEWWLEVVYKVGTDDMKKKYDKPKNICLWTEDELKQKFQKKEA